MRKLNVFFDVDHTLVMWDGRLRNHAHEVFSRLRDSGHSIYVWSGVGIRKWDMEHHGLHEYVTAYFVKPLWGYRARLAEFNVHVLPDFVIDDHKGVVDDLGGYHIPDSAGRDDRELLKVLELIEAAALLPAPTYAAGDAPVLAPPPA
ncbi:MAG: hypothetical protein EXR63_02085 [Dehalococcoidia bacterium]|nr:hypothetical protein [Dehalococcoidia bacterium]